MKYRFRPKLTGTIDKSCIRRKTNPIALISHRQRDGFTIIELVVVTGIVAILASLVLSAVAAARSTARRIECASRLAQLIQAASVFSSQHGVFPGEVRPKTSEVVLQPALSTHALLLPFLDQAAVYRQIDWNDLPMPLTFSPPVSVMNPALLEMPIISFKCPADTSLGGGVSYRVSAGTTPGLYVIPGALRGFMSMSGLPPSRIRDGLSQTTAFSERDTGDRQDATLAGDRDIRLSAVFGNAPDVTADDAAAGCASASSGGFDSYTGVAWLTGGFHTTWYNHIGGPNPIWIDCTSAPQMNRGGPVALSARSNHGQGVNVAFCDGHVRFVNNAVDLRIWRALGTRDGGDQATLE